VTTIKVKPGEKVLLDFTDEQNDQKPYGDRDSSVVIHPHIFSVMGGFRVDSIMAVPVNSSFKEEFGISLHRGEMMSRFYLESVRDSRRTCYIQPLVNYRISLVRVI
jgi:hypothetical protein